MRDNQNTVLVGNKVILVPYRKEHVLTYHQWMQSPSLRELTGSEPLSLEQEYEMQLSWSQDETNCTFILIDPTIDEPQTVKICPLPGAMAGDINLFIGSEDKYEDEDEDGVAKTNLRQNKKVKTGEVNVMVAEERSRRKGIAREAILLFIKYGIENIGIERFIAKILKSNEVSLQLFKSLGFVIKSYSHAFEEYTLHLDVFSEEDGDTQTTPRLSEQLNHLLGDFTNVKQIEYEW